MVLRSSFCTASVVVLSSPSTWTQTGCYGVRCPVVMGLASRLGRELRSRFSLGSVQGVRLVERFFQKHRFRAPLGVCRWWSPKLSEFQHSGFDWGCCSVAPVLRISLAARLTYESDTLTGFGPSLQTSEKSLPRHRVNRGTVVFLGHWLIGIRCYESPKLTERSRLDSVPC
jgi:hypothetical protein